MNYNFAPTQKYNPLITSNEPVQQQSQITNLILIFNIHTNQLENISFSFSPVNSIALIGESEQVLVAARNDGVIDIFH